MGRPGAAGSPSSFIDSENWTGGFYELAMELGEASDARLQLSLTTLWQAARLDGCYQFREHEPDQKVEVSCNVETLTKYGHLYSTVKLPNDQWIVCGYTAVREDSGVDWLNFYVPWGAISRIEELRPRPLEGEHSRKDYSGLRVIDDWFARVGTEVFDAVRFNLGLIGFEISGLVYACQLNGVAPDVRREGYLLPLEDVLRYVPANRDPL